MKTVLDLLTEKGIKVENDIVEEVLRYQRIEEGDSLENALTWDILNYSGELSEQIDSAVPSYYDDIYAWLHSNGIIGEDYVEQAREQGLIGEDSPLHKQIQAGIYLQIEENVNEELSRLQDLVRGE